jgi:hypothetical protein
MKKVLHTINTFEFCESNFPSVLPEGYSLSSFKIDHDERLRLPFYD